jgi:hypothetical protein
MNNEVKKWNVTYSHEDGRSGTVKVVTEIQKSNSFRYGNGKAGGLTIDGHTTVYDLRYEHGDFHRLMLDNYFGKGLVKTIEIV